MLASNQKMQLAVGHKAPMQLTDPKHQSGVRMSKLPDFPFFQLLTFRFSGKILTPGLIRTRDDSLSLFVYVASSGSGTFPPQDQLPRVNINYLFMHLIILKSPSTGQYSGKNEKFSFMYVQSVPNYSFLSCYFLLKMLHWFIIIPFADKYSPVLPASRQVKSGSGSCRHSICAHQNFLCLDLADVFPSWTFSEMLVSCRLMWSLVASCHHRHHWQI